MSKIKSITGREILDSRLAPTIEVRVCTSEGTFFASVPSGISKGKYEAKTRAVPEAIKNLKTIIYPALKGKDVSQQEEIDELLLALDGTKDKSRLGANTILAVSMACCRAGAGLRKLPLYQYISQLFHRGQASADFPNFILPYPCFNILEGGAHGRGNELSIQEFMIMPQFSSFAKNFHTGKEIYLALKELLEKKFGRPGIKLGDEAGFAPLISRSQEALDFLRQALKRADCLDKTKIGLDCAASQFYQTNQRNGCYFLEGGEFGRDELLNFYQHLVEDNPIIFLEDPFSQDDWQGWQMLMSNVKCPRRSRLATLRGRQMSNVLIIGDDLTTTNPGRIKMAKEKNACNGVIIKPNQIGTVTETVEAAKLAKEFEWKIIVSHRSGETNDDFIADLAVGLGAEFIKSGAPAKPERLAKYNRLVQIEQQLSNV